MGFKTILNLSDFKEIVIKNKGALFYFSTLSCAVGEALEPKVIYLLKNDFPKIPFYFININATPKIAAKYGVFVEPTILIFFEGKEAIRKSRHISMAQLKQSIARLYKLVF